MTSIVNSRQRSEMMTGIKELDMAPEITIRFTAYKPACASTCVG